MHCVKFRAKAEARNKIIRKLIGSKWEADAKTLRTSALALCFSAGEYACPVWGKSTHSNKVDMALNETV